MTFVRTLAPSEFQRLADVADGTVPGPDNVAVVAEDGDGSIIGRMLIVPIAHLEGTWLAESARRGLTAARMFAEIEKTAKAHGLKALMAYSTSGEHDAYLHRLGFKRMPWTVWGKEFECR